MKPDFEDPNLTALHEYWASKCRGREMPRRADIEPAEIPALLPIVFLIEIHEPMRFRFRLIGSAICDRWNENNVGKWLDEVAHDGEIATVLGQYASAVRSGTPRYDTEEFVNENGQYLHYRRLLLPLSEDGHTPNMLIGGQNAIGIDGYKWPLPKWA
jgi:hypothetical protein